MTPKERFAAAMNFKQPDDMVAFMELEIHIYDELVGEFPTVGYEYSKLSSAEKEKALYRNAEIMVQTAELCGHDAIRGFGGYWELSPGQPAVLWLPEELDQLNQIKALNEVSGGKYFILGKCTANMSIPDGSHIYDFVEMLFERPEEVREQNEKILHKAIEWQNKLLEYGADGIINPADIAFNSGPFISPAQCDEFFFPYFNRWVESLKRQNVISIWHTDGNIMPLIPRVLESGVTAIQCIDPLAGMDIVQLKKEVKDRLALIGNIDCSMLQLGSREEIDREVKCVVEGCKGDGGFALSGCNAIFKGISVKNYSIMIEGRRKYGA